MQEQGTFLGGRARGALCTATAQSCSMDYLMLQEPDCLQLSHHCLICVFI